MNFVGGHNALKRNDRVNIKPGWMATHEKPGINEASVGELLTEIHRIPAPFWSSRRSLAWKRRKKKILFERNHGNKTECLLQTRKWNGTSIRSST